MAVTFQALQQGGIDVFLRNWMPPQDPIATPLTDSGAIDVVADNLEGALIGFAVPATTYEARPRTYADIAKFEDELGGQIYGIEAGSSANAAKLAQADLRSMPSLRGLIFRYQAIGKWNFQ